jgi:uncharacterized protein (TIGR03083 family)
MNALDVLFYGHRTLLGTLEGVPESDWTTPGVCGVWSVKDIVAHLASYECVLHEVIAELGGGGGPTPTLDRYRDPAADFNDAEVAARRDRTPPEALAEYTSAHERSLALVAEVPEAERARPGTLPWYGAEYALDDYLVYAFYGHKREHSAQVAVFRDR